MKTLLIFPLLLFLSTGCATSTVSRISEDNIYNRRPETKASAFKKTSQNAKALQMNFESKSLINNKSKSQQSVVRAVEVNGQAGVRARLPLLGNSRTMTRLEEEAQMRRQMFHHQGHNNNINSIDREGLEGDSAAQLHDAFNRR